MRRRLSEELERPTEINVVPLIDVLFALLTFFILSTLFLVRSEGLPVNLPRATTSKPQAASRSTVSIDKAGKVFLNKAPIPVDNLATTIKTQLSPGQELVVVLNADGSVTHSHVIEVMDQLRQVPGAKLAIATQRK
ncbi:MAG: biopolymer transporter ExbD [Lyngbya sp. HA4199-MV5]|jgi:biopolymer transport protein ExbD|nr:biopolymer transporter ExbD [Lyngbya sp. HA4199-MV5]